MKKIDWIVLASSILMLVLGEAVGSHHEHNSFWFVVAAPIIGTIVMGYTILKLSEERGAPMRVSDLKDNEDVKILSVLEQGTIGVDNFAHEVALIERQDYKIRYLVIWPFERDTSVVEGWTYRYRDGKLVSIKYA